MPGDVAMSEEHAGRPELSLVRNRPIPENRSVEGIPRPIEAAVALVGLGASAPILAAAGLLIRATSPGPVLFRQTRVGRGGRPFTLYKLRTMRQAGGTHVTRSGDARVTAVGRLLRKTKLDELPELFNVLRGDLSLVGPRPEVPRYVKLEDPRWQAVLEERPGLTHPVTLRLRNEEEFLAAAPGDAEDYYEQTLLPYKLQGCIEYQTRRTWLTDVQVVVETALTVLMPGRANPPTPAEVQAAK